MHLFVEWLQSCCPHVAPSPLAGHVLPALEGSHPPSAADRSGTCRTAGLSPLEMGR